MPNALGVRVNLTHAIKGIPIRGLQENINHLTHTVAHFQTVAGQKCLGMVLPNLKCVDRTDSRVKKPTRQGPHGHARTWSRSSWTHAALFSSRGRVPPCGYKTVMPL